MQVKNFLFHRVSDQPDKLWPPMPPALFEEIIKYLCDNYEIRSLETIVEKCTPSAKKVATVLFDDGYKDNIEYAVPILKKYNCPASFYVVTSCIDNNIPTWTYIVDHLFQHTRKNILNLEMDYVPLAFRSPDCSDYQKRLAIGSKLKPWMKSLSNFRRKEVLDQLRSAFNDVDLPQKLMMNWNDLRQMKAEGYIIGSHSVTHPLLATIKEEEELSFELRESGNRIKAELGEFPQTISYPVGSFDQQVINGARKAGYQMGLAVEQRFYDTNKDEIFAIPRVELYNESMWKTKLRISGIYNWLKRRIAK